GIQPAETSRAEGDAVRLPSGSFSVEELLAILNTLPVDITFVDKNDKVKYFSQGKERIFDRNRAILGRDVRMCHPPSSVHVVEQILTDFKNGKELSAAFWIQMQGRFVHIEYFALRDTKGEYLGSLEVSQDLTEKRALQGEQRILSYTKEK
ncbi:MAG: PAS domain-containing protein, partial [Bacteroidota bacterium]